MTTLRLPLEPPARIVVDMVMTCIPSRRWPWHSACHLFHLDYDLEALDAFAVAIGMRRHWRHDTPGFIHYDLHPATRVRAVTAGAREISRRDPEFITFLRARSERMRPGMIINERA